METIVRHEWVQMPAFEGGYAGTVGVMRSWAEKSTAFTEETLP